MKRLTASTCLALLLAATVSANDAKVTAAPRLSGPEITWFGRMVETHNGLNETLTRSDLIRSNMVLNQGVEQAKVDAAKVQLETLDKAVNIYFVRYAQFPASLMDLIQTPDGKALVKDAKALKDPWEKDYQYNPAGPKTKKAGGVGPDIWTVTPAKQEIGNWQFKKKG